MVKVIMVGNVSVIRPKEKYVSKPMYVPDTNELIALGKRYRAYVEYTDSMAAISFPKPSPAAFRTAAEAIAIKRYMDRIYKRWRRR